MKSHEVCFFLLTVLFLAVFNNTITNMAGFYIVSDLGGNTKISVYPMVFYGLGSLLSLPLAAPMGERFKEKNILVISLLLFGLFTLLSGLSSTFLILNVFRFLAGFSSGPFYIICRDLINKMSPSKSLSTYSFLIILILSIVPVLGASFGAWIAYDYQWRWVFHGMAPFPILLAFYFWIKLSSPEEKMPLPFDGVGYLFFFIGMTTLVTSLTMAEELDWFRSYTFTSLIITGALSLIFFILWDYHHPTPLFGFSLLKNLRLSFSLFNLAILFSAYFGMIFLIALWLNIYANYTPIWVALLIGTMGFAGILAIPIGHLLLQKFEPRVILGLAILSFMSSCYYSTFFDVDVDFFHLSVARFLAGLGLMLFIYPLFIMALSSYGSQESNRVFTIFQAVRMLSSSLGAALYVIVWHRRQIFFYERLGEKITPFSQKTIGYFEKAHQEFILSYEQTKEELSNTLTEHATSLALNDAFGLMGYIMLALFALLILSFLSPLNPEKALS